MDPNLGRAAGGDRQDFKFCITVYGKGSTEWKGFAIGGPRLKKVGKR